MGIPICAMREEFEAVMAVRRRLTSLERDKAGHYLDPDACMLWSWWQTAWQRSAEQPARQAWFLKGPSVGKTECLPVVVGCGAAQAKQEG